MDGWNGGGRRVKNQSLQACFEASGKGRTRSPTRLHRDTEGDEMQKRLISPGPPIIHRRVPLPGIAARPGEEVSRAISLQG
jgi:hypothetical protein